MFNKVIIQRSNEADAITRDQENTKLFEEWKVDYQMFKEIQSTMGEGLCTNMG